jgi:signal transduction histidine kinase
VATLLGLVSLYNHAQPDNPQNSIVISRIDQTAQKLDTVIKDLNQILEYKTQIHTIREKVMLSETLESVKTGIDTFIAANPCTITHDFSQIDEVYTIKSYLHSVFHNLLSNAIKYRDTSKNTLIHIYSELEEHTIRICFKDNGVGIDLAKYKDIIFGLYKRFHLQIEGKGLGLHLVKTQVEAMNGKISVESTLGTGSTFTITLPKEIAG